MYEAVNSEVELIHRSPEYQVCRVSLLDRDLIGVPNGSLIIQNSASCTDRAGFYGVHPDPDPDTSHILRTRAQTRVSLGWTPPVATVVRASVCPCRVDRSSESS